MPGFDGTGPMGQGPMSGRGRGNCAVPTTELIQSFHNYGFFDRRRGHGSRNCFWTTCPAGWMRGRGMIRTHNSLNRPINKGDEIVFLEERAGILKKQLTDIEIRLKEIENTSGIKEK